MKRMGSLPVFSVKHFIETFFHKLISFTADCGPIKAASSQSTDPLFYSRLPVRGRYPVNTIATLNCGNDSRSAVCLTTGIWDAIVLTCSGNKICLISLSCFPHSNFN